jgi:hypothetical protein
MVVNKAIEGEKQGDSLSLPGYAPKMFLYFLISRKVFSDQGD